MLLADPITEETRTLVHLRQLEQQVGMRLEIVSRGTLEFSDRSRVVGSPTPTDEFVHRCLRNPGKAQFLTTPEETTVGVAATTESVIVGCRHFASSTERELFRRLFESVVRQLRTDEELRQRDTEVECLVNHVSRLYEQIHGIFQVSRALTLEEPFERILQQIEQSSPGTLAADQLCLLSIQHPEAGEEEGGTRRCSGHQFRTTELDMIAERLRGRSSNPVLLMARDLPQSRIGSVLAVRLRQKAAETWLVASRSPNKPEFGSEEASYLLSVSAMLESHLQNASLYEEKDQMLMHFVHSLIQSLDARDHDTQGHSTRVAAVAQILATELRLPPTDVALIHMAGLLHDLGKIGISDEVLKKTEPLTPEDWVEIKRHPVIGYEILSGLPQLSAILPGVRSHHERMDGLGYPDGLKGSEIPLMARVLAVADAFDAMLSHRAYRNGLCPETVDRILREGAGTHWDPRVLDAYFARYEQIHHEWKRLMAVDSSTAGSPGAEMALS